MSLHSDRSDAVLHIISLFNELRSIAHKRLTTTVEEDNSARVKLIICGTNIMPTSDSCGQYTIVICIIGLDLGQEPSWASTT
jgi:hypothetical protein